MGLKRNLLGRDSIAVERLDREAVAGDGVESGIDAGLTPTKTGSTALQAQVVVPSLQIIPGTATQPACNASNRALHWFVQGTPDHEQVCVQTATAGTYAWVQVF